MKSNSEILKFLNMQKYSNDEILVSFFRKYWSTRNFMGSLGSGLIHTAQHSTNSTDTEKGKEERKKDFQMLKTAKKAKHDEALNITSVDTRLP